jgi:hypothetical protein
MDSQTIVRDTPPVSSVTTTTGSNTDGWKYRRRFMFAITVFDMAVVIVGLLFAKQESVAQIGVIMAFGSLTAIFGFYVAGAVWDDHSIRTTQMQGLSMLRGGPPPGDGKDDGHDGP